MASVLREFSPTSDLTGEQTGTQLWGGICLNSHSWRVWISLREGTSGQPRHRVSNSDYMTDPLRLHHSAPRSQNRCAYCPLPGKWHPRMLGAELGWASLSQRPWRNPGGDFSTNQKGGRRVVCLSGVLVKRYEPQCKVKEQDPVQCPVYDRHSYNSCPISAEHVQSLKRTFLPTLTTREGQETYKSVIFLSPSESWM